MSKLGIAYLRTSVGDSDESRQRDEIQKWADREHKTIDRELFDPGGKRHESERHTRKQWQEMMALVKADQVDFIVIEEHTRWGYKDIYEFYEHMALLRRHRVILFEARTGRILNRVLSAGV
jgi:DNA invertase Pin-like site-specific DNA recombinase